MNKQVYVKPEAVLTAFVAHDVVRTSAEDNFLKWDNSWNGVETQEEGNS